MLTVYRLRTIYGAAIILTKNTLLWYISYMDKDNDKRDTIEVDPSNVKITGAKDRSFFGSVFDIFGDFDDDEGEDFPVDVFDRDFIEVNDVEIIDADGSVKQSHNGKTKDSEAGKMRSAFDRLKNKFRK